MIIECIISAVVALALQLLFCFKAKKVAVRLIPVYLLLFGVVCCCLIYAGVFGTSSMGALAGHQLFALVVGLIIMVACGGSIVAWLIYGIYRRLRRAKN